MMQNGIRELLRQHPLIPVVTIAKASEAVPLMNYLRGRGVMCMEVTLRTDAALEAIAVAKENATDGFSVGVGTIKKEVDVRAAQQAGADFLVSPGFTPSLLQAMETSGIPYIPGAVTPSELMLGMEHGIDTFKFFPANVFGGMPTLKNYAAVFQSLKFCPTGGITSQSAADYLAMPNVISVGGSWFQREQHAGQ